MIKIHFILNPRSGEGNNGIDQALLHKYFSSTNFNVVVKPTTYKKHAIKLTQESIEEEADIIVACVERILPTGRKPLSGTYNGSFFCKYNRFINL